LANDLRAGGKLKIVSSEDDVQDSETNGSQAGSGGMSTARTAEDRKSLRKVARELREILALLDTPPKKH